MVCDSADGSEQTAVQSWNSLRALIGSMFFLGSARCTDACRCSGRSWWTSGFFSGARMRHVTTAPYVPHQATSSVGTRAQMWYNPTATTASNNPEQSSLTAENMQWHYECKWSDFILASCIYHVSRKATSLVESEKHPMPSIVFNASVTLSFDHNRQVLIPKASGFFPWAFTSAHHTKQLLSWKTCSIKKAALMTLNNTVTSDPKTVRIDNAKHKISLTGAWFFT